MDGYDEVPEVGRRPAVQHRAWCAIVTDSAERVSTRVAAAIETTYRAEWTRIVAGLVRRYGDVGLAEDAAAEAFATAAHRWRDSGLPVNPGAWIATAAHRRAIDTIRREGARGSKHHEALLLHSASDAEQTAGLEDDRLRLLFTCCHPSLSMESRIALTLRIVGGLTVGEIARAFLVRDTTMGQRISRAKSAIKTAGIPYRVPSEEDITERVDGVLTVLYSIFNEGYLSTTAGSAPLRSELTAEAIRLARLVQELLPGDDEVSGLLALMLFSDARATARLTADGELVRLADQDRTLWDRALIEEASALSTQALENLDATRNGPGRYLLMAAINAEHAGAAHADTTDWARIVQLYELLEQLDPGPVVALAKTVAISERDHPEVALVHLDRLQDRLALFHPYHVTRAELLRAVHRPAEARRAYDRALSLTDNSAEIAHLIRRRDQLARSTGPESSGPLTTSGGTP